MKTITEFNRANCRSLQEEIAAALEPIAKKHGLTLDRKRGSFYKDKMPAMFQFLVTQEDKDGNALSAAAIAFQQDAWRVGLDPKDLGREFTSQGKRFRISGLNLRAKKYPVLAVENGTGKTFKFPAERVKDKLESEAA